MKPVRRAKGVQSRCDEKIVGLGRFRAADGHFIAAHSKSLSYNPICYGGDASTGEVSGPSEGGKTNMVSKLIYVSPELGGAAATRAWAVTGAVTE